MPIARIIFEGKANNENILIALHRNLQGIIANSLDTSEYPLKNEDIELIFEEGHHFNRGSDLRILVDGNDIPERIENLQERSDKIAKLIGNLLNSSGKGIESGFVYITLQAGGLGKFKF